MLKGSTTPKEIREKIRLATLKAIGIDTKISGEELYSLYWDEQLSAREIAETRGVCEQTIFGWLKHFNILRRCAKEARNLSLAKHPAPIGKDNPSWKGGRRHTSSGYIEVWLASNKYKAEHRLVMEQYLGRELLPWEIVHHINGIKDDNRIENLKLLPEQANHIPITLLKRRLNKQEQEIRLLKCQVKILTERLNKARIGIPKENYEEALR